MNILHIVVDTLRADHLGCYGYPRDTSPRIDAFAKEAALFETACATGIPTHPAFATIFSGQHPIAHGVVAHGACGPIPADMPWLPAVLQEQGYTTCAVDNLEPWRPGFIRGFEFYLNPSSRERLSLACSNRAMNRRAIPWLEAHAEEQFYLFVHYWDPHTPYLPPRAYRSLFYEGDPRDPASHGLDAMDSHPLGKTWRETWFAPLGGVTDPEYVVGLYDGEVRYLDEGVGALLETLDRTGCRDDTLVVLQADHGELFYRHGVYFDHHGLYPGNTHVPLMIRHPHIVPGRIAGLAAHEDVAPTMLELCGIEPPPAMMGHSWARRLQSGGEADAPKREFAVLEECTWQMKWGLRTQHELFILAREPDFYGRPPRERYDLAADPHALCNVVQENPERADQLEARLEGWIAAEMARHGHKEDPLKAHGLTLGKRWQSPAEAG